MKETYRKRGSVARWENGVVVRVSECGVAVEDGDVFECFPESSDRVIELSSDRVIVTAERITSVIPFRIERLIVTEGTAEHECDGRVWTDETKRVHLAIVRDGVRALIDDERDVATVVDALTRCGDERDAPPRLRLAPNVAAALLPSLVGLAPPNIRVLQSAGGVDGKGLPIVEGSTGWYRPSYRIRPVRMPLNLRVECDVTEIERDRPVAVALLAPVDGLVMRVLVDDGERAWPCTVRVTRIDAVAHEAVWYPYGAGSFGAEMML